MLKFTNICFHMVQSFITLYLQHDEYSGVVKTIFTYIGIKVGVQEGSECVDTRGVSGIGVGSRGFIEDRGDGVDVGRRRKAGVV